MEGKKFCYLAKTVCCICNRLTLFTSFPVCAVTWGLEGKGLTGSFFFTALCLESASLGQKGFFRPFG